MNCGRGGPLEDLRKEERSGQREGSRRGKVFFFFFFFSRQELTRHLGGTLFLLYFREGRPR